MSQPVLYIFVGYPGAGKTTAAGLIEKLTGAEHIWVDQERHRLYGKMYRRGDSSSLYTTLNKQAEQLLRAGKSVVYDTNFGFYGDRALMRSLAEQNHAQLKLIWLSTSQELAEMRAIGDQSHAPTRQYTNMSADDFKRIAGHLEPPHEDEHAIQLNGEGLTADILRQALGLGTI